jgi:hypothetical protein
VIHPFAHLNSNYASAQLRARAGADSPAPAAVFGKLLRSEPAKDVRLEIPAAESPDPEPPPEPANPPTRSRTGQTPAPEPAPASTTPHFESVAESMQFPLGPYRQAPEEYGGDWWLTNPFTGEEPWKTQGSLDPYAETVDESDASGASPEFLAVFGPRPNRDTEPNPILRSAAVADWERNLEYFQGVGVPEGFTQEQVDAASAVFEAWGMGRPLFYEGRYGWTAVFPSAEPAGFEASPYAALEAPHLVVARYQIELAANGAEPSQRHPFVPPQVFGGEPLSV